MLHVCRNLLLQPPAAVAIPSGGDWLELKCRGAFHSSSSLIPPSKPFRAVLRNFVREFKRSDTKEELRYATFFFFFWRRDAIPVVGEPQEIKESERDRKREKKRERGRKGETSRQQTLQLDLTLWSLTPMNLSEWMCERDKASPLLVDSSVV